MRRTSNLNPRRRVLGRTLSRQLVAFIIPPLWLALGAGLAVGYTNNIMITGYWPPTNEMVRPFSSNPKLNPEGWIGQDWEGRGYNIYSFFPEFDDFPNDEVGHGDFTVDYQDTSSDWWRITEEIRPVAIITFSRTDQRPLYWELETIQRNWANWIPDNVAPTQPTPSPPDSSVPPNTIRPSTLPVQEIRSAILAANLGLQPRIDNTQGGGRFLSEFIAYHGTWYHDLHSDPADPFYNVAAGHIHVGGGIQVPIARQALDITLRELITHVDNVLSVPEPALTMFAGLGGVCGWGMLRHKRR